MFAEKMWISWFSMCLSCGDNICALQLAMNAFTLQYNISFKNVKDVSFQKGVFFTCTFKRLGAKRI